MKHPFNDEAEMALVFLGGLTLIGGIEESYLYPNGGKKKSFHYPLVVIEQPVQKGNQVHLSINLGKLVNFRSMIPVIELGDCIIFKLHEDDAHDQQIVTMYQQACKTMRARDAGLTLV